MASLHDGGEFSLCTHYPEDQMQMTESKKLVVLALRHMFRHIAAG
jgi:hypothetical protein